MRHGCGLQRGGVILETDDVFAHHGRDGGVQLRMHQTLDLVGIVRGGHGARADPGKIAQGMDAGEIIGSEAQVLRYERGVRLVAHVGLDANLVHAVSDALRRDITGQDSTFLVQIPDLRHLAGGKRHQLVRAFQVVVLQGRRVDMRKKLILVFAVGLRRVEVLRALDEGSVKDGLACIRRRIGGVPQAAVAAGQQREQQYDPHRSHGARV